MPIVDKVAAAFTPLLKEKLVKKVQYKRGVQVAGFPTTVLASVFVLVAAVLLPLQPGQAAPAHRSRDPAPRVRRPGRNLRGAKR